MTVGITHTNLAAVDLPAELISGRKAIDEVDPQLLAPFSGDETQFLSALDLPKRPELIPQDYWLIGTPWSSSGCTSGAGSPTARKMLEWFEIVGRFRPASLAELICFAGCLKDDKSLIPYSFQGGNGFIVALGTNVAEHSDGFAYPHLHLSPNGHISLGLSRHPKTGSGNELLFDPRVHFLAFPGSFYG